MRLKYFLLLVLPCLLTSVFAKTTTKAPAKQPPIDSLLVEMSTTDLGAYGAQWWQWIATQPENENVLTDSNGAYCSQNQNGDVWFLAGSKRAASVLRKCTIPSGKYIFFPALTTFQSQKGTTQMLDCEQLKRKVEIDPSNVSELEVIVDRRVIKSPKLFLAATGCFNYFGKIPEKLRAINNVEAASDGYWFMLKPLPVGEHTLSFLVRYAVPGKAMTYVTQRVTYNLTIVGQ